MSNRKDTGKWVAILIALIVLFVGVGTSLYMLFKPYIFKPEQEIETEVDQSSSAIKESDSVISVSSVIESGINLSFEPVSVRPLLASGEGAPYVTRMVTATITPSMVIDKYVTWSLAWDQNAALKNQDISDYMTITQEIEGDLTAQLNCYQSFKGSKIVLTCTTRQGSKRATAEVVFQGAPSEMVILSPSGASQTDLGRDTVDLLFVGNTYYLDFELDNMFHDVGTGFGNYSVTVSGVGTVICGDYVVNPRGRGWNSRDTIVNFSTIADKFITASITNDRLVLNVTKSFYEYYESSDTHNAEGIGETTVYSNKLYLLNTDGNGNLPYFVITVTHNTLDFYAEYLCFIGEPVSSVALNNSTVVF